MITNRIQSYVLILVPLDFYQPMGDPVPQNIGTMLVANETAILSFISFDGINDHIFVPRRDTIYMDFNEDKISDVYEHAYIPAGTQFYGKVETGTPTSHLTLTLFTQEENL